MEIRKKARPELFQAVLEGKKNFDLRLNDEEINEGDILILKEYDSTKKEYTGRELKKKVKFTLKTKDLNFWDKDKIDELGFVVIGF